MHSHDCIEIPEFIVSLGRGRDSASSSPLHSSPRATGVSPLVSGAGAGGDRAAGSPPSAVRSANDSLSDTSAFVSSLAQDMSHSPSISSLPTSTPSTPRRVIVIVFSYKQNSLAPNPNLELLLTRKTPV